MTITYLSHTDDGRGDLTRARDAAMVAEMAYDTLLRAVQATLAADALSMKDPLVWLREALTPGQLPPAGTRPTDYVPVHPEDATWGWW
jgi:hypothetical protein